MKTLLKSCLAAALVAAAQNALSADGKAVYGGTCIACHGADGVGTIPGVPDLTEKAGRLSQPDSVLIKKVTEGGQSPGSPLAMPPKGGNPSLTDADIKAVIDYMKATFAR